MQLFSSVVSSLSSSDSAAPPTALAILVVLLGIAWSVLGLVGLVKGLKCYNKTKRTSDLMLALFLPHIAVFTSC